MLFGKASYVCQTLPMLKPTGGGDDGGGGAPAPSYTKPSQDPYAEAGRPTGGGRDDDGPSAAQQAAQKALSSFDKNVSEVQVSSFVNSGRSNLPKVQDEAEKVKEKLEQQSKGIITGFNEGGLVGKPKKKKATPKKRGMAARK